MKDNERSPLATLIRRRCREMDLTVQQLADRAEVSRAHLYKLTTGATQDPSINTLMKLARALKTPPIALFRLFMGPTVAKAGAPRTSVVMSQTNPGDTVAFSADVTIPDHDWVLPRERFTKTWSIQNVGSMRWENRRIDRIDNEFVVCRWVGTKPEPVVQAHMASMANSIEIADTPPGMPIDITMEFTAPEENCSVASLWRMRDADGQFSFPPQFVLQVIVTVIDT